MTPLTNAQRDDVLTAIEKGIKQDTIARMMNIASVTVSCIYSHYKWALAKDYDKYIKSSIRSEVTWRWACDKAGIPYAPEKPEPKEEPKEELKQLPDNYLDINNALLAIFKRIGETNDILRSIDHRLQFQGDVLNNLNKKL